MFWDIKTILSISNYISIFGYIFTLFTNILLIILTVWYVKRKLGTYKKLIVIFSIIGILFDSLDVVVKPIIHSVNASIVYFTLVETTFISRENLIKLLSAYGASFYISTSFLAVMFIHRYFSVTKPAQLFHFQGKRLTLWISYSLLIGLGCCMSNEYFGAPDEYSSNYVASELLEVYNLVIKETPVVIVVVYDADGKIRWKNLMYLIYCFITILTHNAIIVYCGFKIRRKIYCKNTNYSPSLRKLHTQFFKTLVFQVATPTILLVIPVIIIVCLPLFKFHISFPTGALLCLFEIYPAIDSCIVMYIITDYHKAIKGLKTEHEEYDFIKIISFQIYSMTSNHV